MSTIANFPFETLLQIWNAAGVPLVLGTLSSGLFEIIKKSPYLSFINTDQTTLQDWINRGSLTVLALLVQVVFMVMSKQPLSWQLVHDLALQYMAMSVAYTHVYKKIDVSSAVTPTA